MIAKLTAGERKTALKELGKWKAARKGEAIQRSFKFKNFSEAWGFMARVALLADSQDHHPEWFNVWNQVRIDLATHDAVGITSLDVELARSMETLAARLPQK